MAVSGTRAFAVGLSGPDLLAGEAAFLTRWRPWGVILFARNIITPPQVVTLTKAVRDAVGDPGVPILIDQEGGRVQRAGPPNWRSYPPAAHLGALYARDRARGRRATWLHARLIADDLLALGITVDCLPVLDVAGPQTHAVIGSRSYGADPVAVAALGRIACQGLQAGGVLGVMKHLPGHGRAGVDSHHALPVVAARLDELRASDWAPFKAMADKPIDPIESMEPLVLMGMTGHMLFKTLDATAPTTFSPVIISQVIRTEIGFEGLLLSDDLSMKALTGSIGERAARALGAGCDIALHCNGRLDEMIEVAEHAPVLAGPALARAVAAAGASATAIAGLGDPGRFDRDAAIAEFDQLCDAGHD